MSRVVISIISAAFAMASMAYGGESSADRFGDGTLPLGGDVTTFHSDGTLPLRLPGDGTLPLHMDGGATNGAAPAIATSVTLTSATQTPLATAQAASLACQLTGTNVSKHAAAGSVSIGASAYAVRGICFDSASQTMEIVAANGASASSLAAPLAQATPTELTGRLILSGAPTGHYTFDVKTP